MNNWHAHDCPMSVTEHLNWLLIKVYTIIIIIMNACYIYFGVHIWFQLILINWGRGWEWDEDQSKCSMYISKASMLVAVSIGAGDGDGNDDGLLFVQQIKSINSLPQTFILY